MNEHQPDTRSQALFLILIVAALMVCALPWVLNPGAALSLTAYDLAEWTSLVPSVRSGSPALLPTLFLRLPLATLAWMVAFSSINRLATGLFVVFCAVGLLPPLQFFNTPDDVNYRQQFILAVITLVIGGIGISGKLRGWHGTIVIIIGAVSAVGVLWGVAQGYSLMREYGLPTQLGSGGLIFAVCCAGIAIQQTRQFTRRKPPRSEHTILA